MSPTVEVPVCLRDQGIEENDGGIGRVRWARGLSDGNGGVVRGREIYDVSKGSDTTTEAAGARKIARGIYDNDGGVVGAR